LNSVEDVVDEAEPELLSFLGDLKEVSGDKYGPVIATSSACLTTPGATDILTTDPHPHLPINLEHIHHDEYPLKTRFTTGGHEYHWNGHEELVDETESVLAQLSWVMNGDEKIGGLVIKPEGHKEQHLMDLIVMTALVVRNQCCLTTDLWIFLQPSILD
jgi:hypothetical protein